MNGEKVKIKILPLWVIGQQSRTNEPFAAIWLRALPENKWQFPSLIVTEQKSKFTESARNELAAGPACPLKSAQTRLHSVTEQKSEFTESGRNELAAGPACPPEIRYIFFPSGRKSKCCRRPAGGKQQSTGLLLADGSNLL